VVPIHIEFSEPRASGTTQPSLFSYTADKFSQSLDVVRPAILHFILMNFNHTDHLPQSPRNHYPNTQFALGFQIQSKAVLESSESISKSKAKNQLMVSPSLSADNSLCQSDKLKRHCPFSVWILYRALKSSHFRVPFISSSFK
jgi:hypothetical protein